MDTITISTLFHSFRKPTSYLPPPLLEEERDDDLEPDERLLEREPDDLIELLLLEREGLTELRLLLLFVLGV